MCTFEITWLGKNRNKDIGLWRLPTFITSPSTNYGLDELCVSSIKTGARSFIRPNKRSFVVRRSNRTTQGSSSRRIMRVVSVVTVETHKQTSNKWLPKFVQADNAASSMKTANHCDWRNVLSSVVLSKRVIPPKTTVFYMFSYCLFESAMICLMLTSSAQMVPWSHLHSNTTWITWLVQHPKDLLCLHLMCRSICNITNHHFMDFL